MVKIKRTYRTPVGGAVHLFTNKGILSNINILYGREVSYPGYRFYTRHVLTGSWEPIDG